MRNIHRRCDHARATAVDFFERVRFGTPVRSPYVWRVLESCGAAQQLSTAPVVRGRSFLGLRRRYTSELMGQVDELRPCLAMLLRECAWDTAATCAARALDRSPATLMPWREHVTEDALGIFLCLSFRGSAEARLFFEIVRAGYQAHGVPCGLPGWPTSELAIYAPVSEPAATLGQGARESPRTLAMGS